MLLSYPSFEENPRPVGCASDDDAVTSEHTTHITFKGYIMDKKSFALAQWAAAVATLGH